MRQAFMIGVVILWVALNILGAGGEMVTPMSQTDSTMINPATGLPMTQNDTVDALMKPNITNANLTTIFTKLGSTLKLFGKVLTLNYPSLWQGSFAYARYIFLAIGISFWVVFAIAIRGVASS